MIARWYEKVAIRCVALTGPPRVITQMSWKSAKVNSTENVMTTAMMGVSRGEVMQRKRCHGVEPSMSAASYGDGETVCKPASSVMATKGTPRQILAKITDQRAFHGSPRKSILALIRCSFFNDQEMMENCGSNSHQKAMADSTVGTMNGISTTARMIALNGSRSLSSRAR